MKAKRKNGPDVWQFRWSEKRGNGRRAYRKRVIGTIEQYSDAAAAQQLAARIIARPKSLVSRPAPPMTIAELCEHFQHHELSQSDAFRSHSTRRNYIFYLNKWIIPRRKDYELARRKPLWGQAILRKHVIPAAKKIGIQKRIGWHTFRHTYSTLLRSVGAEFKVMQELMRHSSLRSTLNVYTQAVTPAKHEAQAAVLSLVFPS